MHSLLTLLHSINIGSALLPKFNYRLYRCAFKINIIIIFSFPPLRLEMIPASNMIFKWCETAERDICPIFEYLPRIPPLPPV